MAEVLSAAARGDGPAWRELIDRYARRVYAMARSRCRNSDVAEEVTQSVFATVAVKLGEAGRGGAGYAERGRFEAWLFRIAMNRIRDEVRRRDRRAAGGERELEGVEADRRRVGGGGAEADEFVRLRAAMAALPAADREIVDLRHQGGMSFKQMSELLGEPVGTLLARHHRALRKIRATMDGEAEGRGR